MKKGPDGPKYWSYEKVEENGPKIFLMVLGGSAFFTFYLSATVWPQMSKMLTGVKWWSGVVPCNNKTNHQLGRVPGTMAGVEQFI